MAGGLDSYVVLLLHCDGADESTTFTDESDSAHTMTAVNSAQVDTAQSKFGTGSALFDGTTDAITTPNHADFDFSTDDFTIDAWVRFPAAASGSQCICSKYTSAGWIFEVNRDTGIIRVHSNSPSTWRTATAGAALSDDTWYHLAVSKDGTTTRFFKDGVQQGADITSDTANYDGQAVILRVGLYATSSSDFEGWIDELRISAGIARYTTNFTPETSAYSVPATNTASAGNTSGDTYTGIY